MKRKPVAVAPFDDGSFVVLTDDGSMWEFVNLGDGYIWRRIPDLPQPDEKAGATDG